MRERMEGNMGTAERKQMGKYIAHKDGEREQTVKEHLTGTTSGKICIKIWKRRLGILLRNVA